MQHSALQRSGVDAEVIGAFDINQVANSSEIPHPSPACLASCVPKPQDLVMPYSCIGNPMRHPVTVGAVRLLLEGQALMQLSPASWHCTAFV